MRTRLIFVRHAEAEGNIGRVFHGWTDSQITEKGHIQAQRVAGRLKGENIDVLYSSSLKRTIQTAEYISKAKNLPIIRTDKLKEINGGDWEDRRWDELPVVWPEQYDTWEHKPHMHQMPNGESMKDFQARLISEVKYIIDNNQGKDICIVTHGTAIRALMCYFFHCDLDEIINVVWYDNTSVTVIDYENGKFSVVMQGDISHLDKETSTIENQEWWVEYKNSLVNGVRSKALDTQSGNADSPNGKLVKWLFETKAVRVCPQDKPFWYTSGTIGPYYINTHFLYGSEEKANELLKTIDNEKGDKYALPVKLYEKTRDNYSNSGIYKGLIDEMYNFIVNNINIDEIDYVSGGERRDWFFSFIIAGMLNKPHIAIYKDLTAVVSVGKNIIDGTSGIKDKKVLHIADLITEASSYERAWIPAIKNMGGSIKWSVVVVDRKQGGESFLKGQGISLFSMTGIDAKLFETALSSGLINEEQYSMVAAYLENPKDSMKKFLQENPEFLKSALNSDDKTRERVLLCLEKNIYGIERNGVFNIN